MRPEHPSFGVAMSRLVPLSSLGLALVLGLAGCQFVFDRALDPGDIRGTLVIVDAAGNREPAANARVSLENAPVVVRSDAKGRFVVRGLPSGVYSLSVSWKPETGATGEPAALRLRNLDLSEGAGAIDLGTIEIGGLGAVDGVVLGDETNEVEAVLEGVGRIAVKEGVFAFDDLPAGVYEAALIGQGGVWPGGSVTVKARSATPIEIDTREPPITIGSITGTVRRSDGGPLTGLSVSLVGSDSMTDTFDSSGLWSMTEVPAGIYTLVARAPGMFATQIPFLVVAGATAAPDLVLVPRSAGCALGGNEAGDANDGDDDGVPDADEPEVCLCHPGHVDANEDGACDLPGKDVPVTGCSTDDDCSGHPDGELCSVSRGRCVECHGSGDCAPDEFCNVQSACERFGQPPECTTHEDCQQNVTNKVCVIETGFCAECLENSDCDAGESCQGNFCEAIVSPPECETNDECVDHPNGAFCLPDAGVCVGCLDDGDCFRGGCRANNTCGPPPECFVNEDCLGSENGLRCNASEYLCVECLENSDCPSGVCLEDQTCERVPECEAAIDCVGHANGELCLEPEGICVECRDDLDCSGGTCSDHVCVSDGWTVELGENLTRQGSHVLATFGSNVLLGLQNTPADATVEFTSVGSPAVELEPVGAGEFQFVAAAIGTVEIEVSMTLAGETTPQIERVVIQVVHDPARAVFFDPVLGNDANEGTLDEPKRDPIAWLTAMVPTTTKRHLYVREGVITLPDQAPFDVAFDSAVAGTEQIILTGGYGSDAGWTRSVSSTRTRVVQSAGSSASRFTVRGAGTDVVIDGIVIENEEGVLCNDGATLRLLNSQVVARRGRALETNDCEGLAAGNVLLAGDSASLDSAVMFGRMGSASTFRLLHNLVHAPRGNPFTRNGLLGGDVRFNIFVQSNNDFSIDAVREFDGNTFETPDDTPMVEADRLSMLNRALMPQELNRQYRCTDITDPVRLDELRVEGWLATYSQEDCLARTPIPLLDDAISDYALRFDRDGTRRPDDGRNRGPIDLGLGAPQHRVSTAPTDVILQVGVPYVVQGLATDPEVEWSPPQAEGMDFDLDVLDALTGRYQITARSVGSAAVRLTATKVDSGSILRTSSTVVRFDVRPSGNLVFVDFNASTDGDGTELSPRNVWPTALTTGTDVLVAEASTVTGARLSPGWLPDGVRVFGGYARDVDGRFLRRLPVAETNLANISGFTVQIPMGDYMAPATTRVVDGVTFTSSSSLQSALVVAGPLLLVRSRVINPYSTAPAVLEVQEPAHNVAVVGSTIAYRPDPGETSAIDLVRLYPGGDSTFLFNDLHRGYAMTGTNTGSAFKVYDGTAKGVFAGNRYWIDNMDASTYVFFDASMAPAFSPSVLAGNSYAERGSTTITATNIGNTDWDSLGSTEEYANGWGDGCATAWPMSSLWASAPGWDCPDAYDAGQRATALESALDPEARIGVDFDYLGRLRQPMGSTSGATEAAQVDLL